MTEWGEPRWRVTSYNDKSDALARAEREGRYTAPPAKPTAWPEHVEGAKYGSDEVDALLAEMKGDH